MDAKVSTPPGRTAPSSTALKLLPMSPADALSWTRVRAAAYVGPTNKLVHNTWPVSETSVQRVATDRAKEIGKPNRWHWKVVDTQLEVGEDDPVDNGGRTIAVAVWSACNIDMSSEALLKEKSDPERQRQGEGEEGESSQEKTKEDGSNEPASNPAEINPAKLEEEEKPFLPPELRLDVLADLFAPLRDAQKSITGERPYFMLNSLATHPDHRRRGAASMLLTWGINMADKWGLDTYLDATMMGMRLYERWGFELVRGVEWDRTKWGGEGVDWHGCMIRKGRGVNS